MSSEYESIRDNEFATKTLQAVKHFLMLHHADWSSLSAETGQPPLDSEDAATLYSAACTILGDWEFPDGFGDVRVAVGGGSRMPVSAVLALGAALRNGRT